MVTDRAEGGGSIRDGQVEIMVNEELNSCYHFLSLCVDSPPCFDR